MEMLFQRSKRHCFLAAIALLTGLLASMRYSEAREVYQWRDDNNIMRYSDNPPTDRHDYSIILIGNRLSESQQQISSEGFTPTTSRKSSTKPSNKKGKSATRKSRAGTKKSNVKLCSRLETSLKKTQSKLRSGYHEPEGNKLRLQRRMLKDRLYQECD